MASSNGLWAVAAIGLAMVAATHPGNLDATPVSTLPSSQVGQHVNMSGMHVDSVPADEGFWVDSDHGRMWVQIATTHESPYTVRAGDTVSFSGEVVAHDQNFPARVGVTSAEGAADLAAAGAHITIPVNALAFDNDDDVTGTDRTPPGHPRGPADVLDLTNWHLTLPTGADGDPDTVEHPDLETYTSRYFQLNAAKDGVALTANADGVTTKNSTYPRTELREMNGQQKAAWSNTAGMHTLSMTEAVTELPDAKPETVTAQIHDGNDDVLQIRLDGPRLMVQYDDGTQEVTLDSNYRLGTPYKIEIVAADGHVQVFYNGAQKADLPRSGTGWYFKAGAYVQSNTGEGDKASAIGQVVIYSLTVTHSP